jgi:hypothetical protein
MDLVYFVWYKRKLITTIDLQNYDNCLLFAIFFDEI